MWSAMEKHHNYFDKSAYMLIIWFFSAMKMNNNHRLSHLSTNLQLEIHFSYTDQFDWRKIIRYGGMNETPDKNTNYFYFNCKWICVTYLCARIMRSNYGNNHFLSCWIHHKEQSNQSKWFRMYQYYFIKQMYCRITK